MEVTVIDTLRYADRLKAAGVQANHAEAMSRALNDELSGGVATKDDLGQAVDTLDGKLAGAVEKLEGSIERLETKIEGDIGHLENKIESDTGRLESKIEGDIGSAVAEMKGELDTKDAKFEARFSAMNEKFEGKFSAMNEKFDALRDRVDTQARYVFMVLALIAALGLYNAVSPHITAKVPPTADAKPVGATAPTGDA